MLSTLSGIINALSHELPQKAYFPMILTPSGNIASVNVISRNALAPIVVTSCGTIVVEQPTISVLLAVLMMALQLFRESYTEFPSATFKDFRLVQQTNAFSPILSTLAGMARDSKLLQLANASSSITFNDSERTIERRLLQSLKANLPMEVTPEGSRTESSFSQPKKHFSLIV